MEVYAVYQSMPSPNWGWFIVYTVCSCTLMNHKEAVLDETRNIFLTQWTNRKFACLFAPATQWKHVCEQARRFWPCFCARTCTRIARNKILKDRWRSSPMFLRRLSGRFSEVHCSPQTETVFEESLQQINLIISNSTPTFRWRGLGARPWLSGKENGEQRERSPVSSSGANWALSPQVVRSVLVIPHVAHTTPLLLVVVVLSTPDGQPPWL